MEHVVVQEEAVEGVRGGQCRLGGDGGGGRGGGLLGGRGARVSTSLRGILEKRR